MSAASAERGSALARLQARLASRSAREATVRPGLTVEAAVALIVSEPPGAEPELLLIERARREGDPWSGHMAFPGGRREPGDADLCGTARRETREEVGCELAAPLGRLDDLSGPRGPLGDLVVGAYVFGVQARPPLAQSAEVAAALWLPLAAAREPSAWIEYRAATPIGERLVPALQQQGRVIWGLTLLLWCDLLELLGEAPAGAAALRRAAASAAAAHRTSGASGAADSERRAGGRGPQPARE